MSQRTVGNAIDRLLTDEDFRARFVVDRIEALAELTLCGFELTGNEIDVFMRSDARVWFLGAASIWEPMH
jgi:hypothetical protein